MPNSRLSSEVKHLIVRELACYSTPSEAAEAVWQQCGVEVSRQAIEGYNPYRRAGAALSKKWKAIFDETRRNFLKDVSTIGIAHKAVRLQSLQDAMERAKEDGNLPLVLGILALAAKEAP